LSDSIRVEGLCFEAIIGVNPDERLRVQPLRFDLELQIDLRTAGRSGKINDTVDYDQVAREVIALVQFRRYRLIESATEEIAAMLLGLHDSLESVRVSVHKPQALAHWNAVASTSIVRTRTDYPRREERSRFGSVEILLETRDAGLYLLHVDPGKRIPLHRHRVMRELEWVADGELVQNERTLPQGQAVTWSHGQVHGYENRSRDRATLFCCDCPPFIPEDEVDIDGAVTR